jgi:hypothetical protein
VLVVPQVPFRTIVVRQHLILDPSGGRVELDEPPDEEIASPAVPERAALLAAKRAYWQRFIDDVRFDHPDQPPPRHGGVGWVRMPLPSPARWLTAYQYEDRIGVYLVWDQASNLYDELEQQADELRRESGVDLTFDRSTNWIGIARRRVDVGDEDFQIEWLCDTANRLVSALRPRLSQFG